jgi:Fimbrial assembly protein (PilN)
VHVFDEIVRALPEGVYLTHVKQCGIMLWFHGIAGSDTRLSTFMRNIDDSHWLRNPEQPLVHAGSGIRTGLLISDFTLSAEETSGDGSQSRCQGEPDLFAVLVDPRARQCDDHRGRRVAAVEALSRHRGRGRRGK